MIARCSLTILLAAALGGGRPAYAQAEATLELAGTRVSYDGFLPSYAVTVSPAFLWTRPGASILASLVRTFFESGSASTILSLDGARRVAGMGAHAVEVRASIGMSAYTHSDPAGELLGGLRYSYGDWLGGSWIGADGGPLLGSRIGGGALRVDGGAWLRRHRTTLRLQIRPAATTATAFVEATADVDWTWPRGRFAVGGGVHQGVDRGMAFATTAAHLRLARWLETSAAWGRSPPDPLRGSPGARFGMLGLRITSREARQAAPLGWAARAPLPAGVPRLVRIEARGSSVTLVLAAAAATVEVSGDFTHWEPTPLARSEDGLWRMTLTLRPGVYRYNVRIDGGRWIVPAGAGQVEDEFGGRAGVLVTY